MIHQDNDWSTVLDLLRLPSSNIHDLDLYRWAGAGKHLRVAMHSGLPSHSFLLLM